MVFLQKYTAVAGLGTATDTLDVKGNVIEEKKYGENCPFFSHTCEV